MAEENRVISLSGSSYYLSENDTDAYKVVSGTVLIFIVPVKEWGPGRKSFIYEASEGEIIPSFRCRDIDSAEWKFCLTAFDSAGFEIIEYGSTKRLKEKFSEKINISNYREEGFNSGLIEQYKANILKEDILIRRNKNLKSTTFSDTLEMISRSFKKKKINVDADITGNSLYDCVNIICEIGSIPIAPYEKMKEACSDTFDISDIARLSYFSYRKIVLSPGWEKNDSGAFIVFTEKGKPLACIPGRTKLSGSSSYVLYDTELRSVIPLTAKTASLISPEAYMIYRPLPHEKLTKRDIFSFCKTSVSKYDVISFIVWVFVTAVIGLILPQINQKLFDTYIPQGTESTLWHIIALLAVFMIANAMIAIVKNLCNFRITSKITYDLSNAVFDRVFNLPESFFRRYESADLTKRVLSINSIISTTVNVIITGCISLIFMTIYFVRMLSYSGTMSLTALLMIVIYAVIYYLINKISVRYSEESAKIDGEISSRLYQFLNGIAKIRIAGVEDRALYEYLKPYIKLRDKNAASGRISLINGIIASAAGTVFTVTFYHLAVKSGINISVGSFMAFMSLLATFETYALDAVKGFVSLRAIKPMFKRFEPIMLEKPEFEDGCELPGEISGAVEINNVSFAYSDDEPNVLKDINLNIRAGEYIGIVGTSGSGKSTLMKLLLGFEKPTGGKIYYDNKDIEKIDKRELRKKMGVVLQNGKLISGSIYENITITSPGASAADVNRVIEAVGLKDDIDRMPMGIYTVLNEESSTISGGQQQRILIARALISSPKILLFDEATSALDNITQSMVSSTLDKMDITKIVVAHRLSTIINCDRIIVMNKGTVAEEGTYDELMKKQGIFYQLASRQIT